MNADDTAVAPSFSRARTNATAIDVVVTWLGTTIAVERLLEDEAFTLGAGRPQGPHTHRHHLLVDHEAIPSPCFSLVERTAAGVLVQPAGSMTLHVDGELQHTGPVLLGQGSVAVVGVGPLQIRIAEEARAATALARLRDVVDKPLLRVSAVALFAHAAFVALLVAMPVRPPVDDLVRVAATWRSSATSPPRRVAAPTPVARNRDATSTAAARPARRPARRAAGDPRHEALRALASLVGDAGVAANVAALGELDGLRATTTAAAASDAGDAGARGTGPLGGSAVTTTGRLGDDRRREGGDVQLGDKRIATLAAERPVTVGDALSREEIQRVLKRAMASIKHCYERELGSDPLLEGKVVTSWVIAPGGDVRAAQIAATTMTGQGGSAVGACVQRVVSQLRFPAPRGGGEVIVTYPFVFSSGAS